MTAQHIDTPIQYKAEWPRGLSRILLRRLVKGRCVCTVQRGKCQAEKGGPQILERSQNQLAVSGANMLEQVFKGALVFVDINRASMQLERVAQMDQADAQIVKVGNVTGKACNFVAEFHNVFSFAAILIAHVRRAVNSYFTRAAR